MTRIIVLVCLCISFLACCSKPNTVKLVFDPSVPADFKSKIYVNGAIIGEISNLEMDSNHCYAIVSFKSKTDVQIYANYEVGQDNLGRLTLVEKSTEDRGFEW